MIGKRKDFRHELLQPGEYGKSLVNGRWYACTPNGHLGNLGGHDVTEHDDGTITVFPSILISEQRQDERGTWTDRELWHGYLERGVWRSC